MASSSSVRLTSEREGNEINEEEIPRKIRCMQPLTNERYCTDDDAIFTGLSIQLDTGIIGALDALIDKCSFQSVITLTPVKILMCNAADKHEGYPFSKAYCSIDMYDEDYVFGTIFRKGINLLVDTLQKRTPPENRQQKLVLSKLFQYLGDLVHLHLESLEANNLASLTETELTAVVANHLLGKLSTSPTFVIDKQCKGNEKYRKGKSENIPCPCGVEKCQLSGYYGDTSIGNGSVWHGSLDIIINNGVIVESKDGDQNGSPGGKSPVEIKVKSGSLSGSHQIVAETIVFSFLQKQRHPESDNFLFPCIAVSAEDMVVYFYDSLHDILLESSKIPLHGVFTGTATGSVNLIAIIVAWLVVNHKYLCDGVVDEMKITKAGFYLHAESKLSIYQQKLRFGDVGNTVRQLPGVSDKRIRHGHPELDEIRTKAKKHLIKPLFT